MIARCENPKARRYENYGGRGIRVCSRWRASFADFFADMGRRPSADHSLDRYPDRDGNYEPGNCRWATRSQQARNKRNNRLLTVGELSLTMAEWSERTGIHPGTLMTRFREGWAPERIVSEPPHAKFGEKRAGSRSARVPKYRRKKPVRRGSAHPNAKLTESATLDIRAAADAGRESVSAIARRHGVSRVTVRRIARRTSWNHLADCAKGES